MGKVSEVQKQEKIISQEKDNFISEGKKKKWDAKAAISHLPPAEWYQASLLAKATKEKQYLSQGPQVLLLSMVSYGLEYPFVQCGQLS